MYPWNSWRTLFPLLLGVAGLVGFTVYEYRLSKRSRETGYDEHEIIDPIVRFSIFSNSTLVITFAETVLHGIVVWSLLYFLPLYYETVKGYSPIISGIAILPETGLVAPVSVISAFVCTWSGRYRWALWTGWTLATFGSGILYLLGPGTSIPAWIFLNFPVSIGTGILFPVMGLGTQAACAPEDSGHAAAFFSFLRVFGQSIGLAISGVAFQNQLREALLPYPDLAPFATEYSKDATALVNIIKGMPQGSDRMNLIRAYSDALHVIWLLMTALSGVGLISSFFTKEFSLQQEHSTKQRFVSPQS